MIYLWINTNKMVVIQRIDCFIKRAHLFLWVFFFLTFIRLFCDAIRHMFLLFAYKLFKNFKNLTVKLENNYRNQSINVVTKLDVS